MNRNIPTVTILFIFFLAAWFISITNAGSAPTGLIATPNQFTLSNTIIDVGQSSFANTVISGGAGAPYAGQWVFLSSNQVINQVINTITVALYPRSVAFNLAGTLAYVTNEGSDNVNIINTVTNTVINTITVGTYPTDVVVSPSGTLVYVTNQYVTASGAGNVSVINSATNTVINTITVGTKPIGVAFNPLGSLVYVVNQDSGTMSVINVATNTVINTITVGTTPYTVAFNPSGTLAYVTNGGLGTISVINVATNTVINTITVGNTPYGVAFNPSGTLAYVTNQGSNTASVINVATNTVINTIPTGNTPFSVAFNPSGTLAYVTNSNSGTTSVINVATNSVINTVTTNTGPISVAFNPSGTLAYIVNENTENVSVIGNLPETSIQELPQTSNALSLTINAQNSNTLSLTFNGVAYTESTGSNSIYGTWSVYGFAQDNGTKIYYYGSNTLLLSNSLTINPALTVGSVTPASLTIDSGQGITLTDTWSGGTPPYTVKWYTGPAGNTCAEDSTNVLATHSSISGTTDTLSVSPTTTNSYCIGVTDSASTPATQLSANAIVNVNNALSVGAILPSSPTINSGQSITLNANAIGGTSPYVYDWYTIAGTASPTCTAANQIIGQNSNTLQVTPTATNTYAYQVTDSAPINSVACYSGDTVTVKSGTQVSNPYAGGSTGFFGHLPGATTSATSSTTTTTTPTTSANTSVPANIPVIRQSTGVTTQLCNDTVGYYIVYNSINATVHILPGIQSCVNITTKNETSKYIQSNRSIITAINYSTNNTNVSSIAIIHYSCSIPYSDVYPSILRNNTWQKINPFTLNVSACSVSFAVPTDPVIALINSAHVNSTTVSTTISANTTLPQTTTSNSNANQQNQNLLTWTFAIIVIMAIAIIAYYILKNKRI